MESSPPSAGCSEASGTSSIRSSDERAPDRQSWHSPRRMLVPARRQVLIAGGAIGALLARCGFVGRACDALLGRPVRAATGRLLSALALVSGPTCAMPRSRSWPQRQPGRPSSSKAVMTSTSSGRLRVTPTFEGLQAGGVDELKSGEIDDEPLRAGRVCIDLAVDHRCGRSVKRAA
jgi:hypothetical protein